MLRYLMVLNEGEPAKPIPAPAVVSDDLELEDEET